MDIRGKLVSIVGTVLALASLVTVGVIGDRHGVKKVRKFQEGVIANLKKELDQKKAEVSAKDAEIKAINDDTSLEQTQKDQKLEAVQAERNTLGLEYNKIELRISNMEATMKEFEQAAANAKKVKASKKAAKKDVNKDAKKK